MKSLFSRSKQNQINTKTIIQCFKAKHKRSPFSVQHSQVSKAGSANNGNKDGVNLRHRYPASTEEHRRFLRFVQNSLQSITATAIKTARSQSQLTEVKAKLREAEDELVKALAVKTRREAKRMALKDSIASVKERVEVMKTKIQRQRSKCEECASVVSQHRLVLAASEQKSNESNELKDEAQEVISWYNRILGFHVEGGHGVKFTFKNIDENNPNEEFRFTIRHEDDMYTLLNCEPSLKDIDKLIHELNKTNGLFKFVRTMRRKFQEAVTQGSLSMTTNEHQESTFISASAPVFSTLTITEGYEHQGEPTKGNTHLQKQVNQRMVKSAILSPGSASSVCQSPRLKARK